MNKFTVIISAWRAVDFLHECLNSFSGIPQADEILCGIDGCNPTRRYVERVKPCQDKVRFFNSPRNRGNYLMYNTLIPMESNDYVVIFGADDVALPAIGNQFDELHGKFDFLVHCFAVLNHESQVVVTPPRMHPCGGVLLFHKNLINDIGGFMPWRCAADTEFSKRARRNGKTVGYTKDVMFLRRTHNGNVTTSKETGRDSETRKEYIKLTEQFSRDNILRITTKTGVVNEMQL